MRPPEGSRTDLDLAVLFRADYSRIDRLCRASEFCSLAEELLELAAHDSHAAFADLRATAEPHDAKSEFTIELCPVNEPHGVAMRTVVYEELPL